MAQFKLFADKGKPMEEQFMSWNEMIKDPYDKNKVDAYTRCRVILMNGIENNSVITSHAIARMTDNDDVKEKMAIIRRADSQQQQTVNWLTPANQTIVETTLGFEQVAVDLTANLAKNEQDPYFKQVLDFALIEDFDHLFRYARLMEILQDEDPESITQGKTEIKPGRPTIDEHRHPVDEMRNHVDGSKVSAKTMMNYYTIVSAEQQTELFYKAHGCMYANDIARKLYAEIAEIEEEHVTHYELIGDPRLSHLEMMTLMQVNEAYNYYSCMHSEVDNRIKSIWEQFYEMELTHVSICNELLKKYEKKDLTDVLRGDTIEPLIVFEPNKDYVNKIVETQVDLRPLDKQFVMKDKLPKDWASYKYQDTVNAGGVPSEQVVEQAQRKAA